MTIREGWMLTDNEKQNVERIKDQLERIKNQLNTGRYAMDPRAACDDIELLLKIIERLVEKT
jgi:hypothetical protein